MGTKFRTMLAPIGLSTGDGRRFAQGAISLAAVPFSFEWARSREGGHDGAVVVGAVQEAAVLPLADAIAGGWVSAEGAAGMNPEFVGVWAKGELFDSVDRERTPRLAEDVAEAMHLIREGTLGPSVDLDSFEGHPVMAGTDDPVDWAAAEAHFEATGQEPKIELLISQGRVRAATLVSIPAFAETSRPLELIPATGDEAAIIENEYALIASVGAAEATLTPVTAYDRPELTGPTPITYDLETGRIFGHIATWRTCHAGYSEVCVTAPRDTTGGEFLSFNRFPVETADGIVWAGRITAGGRHAGLALSASATISEYDSKTVAAYVRAYEDDHGIAIAGMLEPDLDPGTLAVLSRRKVSGDWRETANGLSLMEVLALSPGPRAHSEPGFPVETYSHAGRQVALVASLSPEPEEEDIRPVMAAPQLDVKALAAEIIAQQRVDADRVQARSSLAATLQEDIDRERAALAESLTSSGRS